MWGVLAVLLYALTAIATGVQIWYLLMSSIWGAPTSPLQYIALIGSIVLLIAAVMSHWKHRASAVASAGGLVLLWLFYGPALYVLGYSLWHNPPLSFRFDNYMVVALAPIGLLIATTAHAGTQFRRGSTRL